MTSEPDVVPDSDPIADPNPEPYSNADPDPEPNPEPDSIADLDSEPDPNVPVGGGGEPAIHPSREAEPDMPGAGVPIEPLSTSRRIDARWASDDTEPAKIADEIRRLETTRTADGSSVAPARALTFIVLVEPEHDDEVRAQLKALGTQRASRTIVIRRFPDRTTLGGRAAVIQDDAIGNGLRETIVLDVGPEDEMDLDGILDPLVLTDVPSVAWVPEGDPRLLMLLRQIVQTVIIDGDAAASVREALDDSRALREVGMRTIDMAWLRSAPWRVRLASLAQAPEFRAQLQQLEVVEIETRPDSRVCGALLAGWLGHRLGWQAGPPLLDASRKRVVAQLRDVDQPLPGLAGITLKYRDGGSRRLSRGPGGLTIADTDPEGATTERTVLGASRGGSGLLPSAMRQVLLPDELDEEVLTATAALDRARVLKQVVPGSEADRVLPR